MNDVNVQLQSLMYKVLDCSLNQTPSHRTDLPMKESQSLNFIMDMDEDQDLFLQFVKLRWKCPFICLEDINENTVNKWKMFGVNKPIPFRIEIKNFEDLRYTYRRNYTLMNFKFGGIKFELPIEKIEDTY